MKHICLRSDKAVISDALCRVVSSPPDNCLRPIGVTLQMQHKPGFNWAFI